MKLFDKLKELIYEDDEESKEEKVAKKIDIDKTSKIVKPKKEINEEISEVEEDVSVTNKRIEKKRKPVVFDDEDFVTTKEEYKPYEPKKIKAEEKPLYGGYRDRNKEKFKPSPIISPVYGLTESIEEVYSDGSSVSYERAYYEDSSKEVTFDTIRQKAFGGKREERPKIEIDEIEKKLLYEMEKDDVPGVDKLTLGDAEEYYNDLGLEYEVDYEDSQKKRTTRSSKNKVLNEKVEKDTQNKVEDKKTKVSNVKMETEEKNLFDLIDMMYDKKE